jgi:hypothetical protein
MTIAGVSGLASATVSQQLEKTAQTNAVQQTAAVQQTGAVHHHHRSGGAAPAETPTQTPKAVEATTSTTGTATNLNKIV